MSEILQADDPQAAALVAAIRNGATISSAISKVPLDVALESGNDEVVRWLRSLVARRATGGT